MCSLQYGSNHILQEQYGGAGLGRPIIKITRIRARRMILIYNEMIYMEIEDKYEGLEDYILGR